MAQRKAKTITNEQIRQRQPAPHDPLQKLDIPLPRPGAVETAVRQFREERESRNPQLETPRRPDGSGLSDSMKPRSHPGPQHPPRPDGHGGTGAIADD